MSSLLRLLFSSSNIINSTKNISQFSIPTVSLRNFSQTPIQRCEEKDKNTENANSLEAAPETTTTASGISIDRTKIIPVETSIRYLQSAAYKETYGDKPVWVPYRRNHKGQFPPRKTRKTCIRKGLISTGNPCPICRDEYLVLDYRNLELLHQFISPHTGQIISYSTTGVCQRKHQQLVIAVERAMDYGLITFKVPFREYNYSEYYDESLLKQHQQ